MLPSCCINREAALDPVASGGCLILDEAGLLVTAGYAMLWLQVHLEACLACLALVQRELCCIASRSQCKVNGKSVHFSELRTKCRTFLRKLVDHAYVASSQRI